MPDVRIHRGPHPEDRKLFDRSQWEKLRRAVAEYSWLLSRGYAMTAALKLTGDRYALAQRQRLAVMRSGCSDEQRERRLERRVEGEALSGRMIDIDGYNVLTTVEAALSGGVLLRGRDGCLRDLASMHGTYRKVTETRPALERIGEVMGAWGAGGARWYLDRPVSNSGRLKGIIEAVGRERGWVWEVEIVPSPDWLLKASERVIATADGPVLDECGAYVNLAAMVVGAMEDRPVVVDLDASV